MSAMRRTTIIATLGPASRKTEAIASLIRAGAGVFRMNFSHGNPADHAALFDNVRNASRGEKRAVAVMQDLQGPKIRVGDIEGGGMELVEGKPLVLRVGAIKGRDGVVGVSYPYLTKDVKANDRILLDDGKLEVRARKVRSKEVECEVVAGGFLKPKKGLNLPGVKLSTPSITRKDFEDIRTGAKMGVDYVAVSFVRRAEDVLKARKALRARRSEARIVAKIERPEALDNIDAIIEASDGIMVARGDLGIETSPQEAPIIQKILIEKSNARRKFVIIATQMLDSMERSKIPTRAEASDVANAVFDGADAVMLSGETASGLFPVESVEMMDRICRSAESFGRTNTTIPPPRVEPGSNQFSEAVAHASVQAAEDLNASLIVAFTQSGQTAALISKYHPPCPVLGLTMSEAVARRMAMYWGVVSAVAPKIERSGRLIEEVDRIALGKRIARRNDIAIITFGLPVGAVGSTNLMKIHRVGEASTSG